MPLVSCILPVFNGERFLAEALGSILRQEGLQQQGALDVIVIDDGSTDRSAAIAASHGDIRIISQANAGLAAARNAGLAAARGELIAFLDADDLWLPAKLDHQIALLRARADVDLCFGLMRDVAVEGSAGAAAPSATPRIGRVVQAMLARRRVFDPVGGFDTSRIMRADQDWLLRARECGLVEHVLDEVVLHRRIHGANRSITHHHLVAEEFLAITRGALERRRRLGQEIAAVEHWTADTGGAKS